MSVYLNDPDVTLYHGDALEVLRSLPDGSVDCVVTSPPYWGLRDYGTNGQLGLEATPDEYVAAMVNVFREVRRVMADHGTCWVNLGDSYNNRNVSRQSSHQGGLGFESDDLSKSWADLTQEGRTRLSIENGDLKEKDLVGVPWMVAFALRADGWYLRSDIVWAKPNPMPESVTDRPTKSHEYVFLLTKRPRYFFDQEAVREPHTPDGRVVTTVQGGNGSIQHRDGERWPNGGRNVRSVWTIATQPYPEAHFATFPEELARRCIVAGCPERVCRVCGKPSERIVDVERGGPTGLADRIAAGGRTVPLQPGNVPTASGKAGGSDTRGYATRTADTLGWSDCGHNNWRPGLTLDPFIGSGTVAKVARDHQRHAIGIDLNHTYLELAARRLQQLSLLAEA